MSDAAALSGGVHHVGMSVADLDEALGFWRRFLGVEARWRTMLERPYLARHLGSTPRKSCQKPSAASRSATDMPTWCTPCAELGASSVAPIGRIVERRPPQVESRLEPIDVA